MNYKSRREAYSYPTVGLAGSLSSHQHKYFASTIALDEYHRDLLRSEREEKALLGYLSVIYWGHYASSDGRNLAARAAARVTMARDGQLFKHNASVCRRRGLADFAPGAAFDTLQRAVVALDGKKNSNAVRILCELPQIQFAFATKLCAFIKPDSCGVMDSVLATRLPQFGFTVSKQGYVRLNQENLGRYDRYCAYLTKTALELNLEMEHSRWVDRDQTQHAWRALDVERALFG